MDSFLRQRRGQVNSEILCSNLKDKKWNDHATNIDLELYM